jgi:hypothetical protein
MASSGRSCHNAGSAGTGIGSPLKWLVVGAVACGSISGCVSTQQRAAWLHVTDARLIAAESTTVVRHQGALVVPTRVWLVRAGRRVAIAVRLRNATGRSLADLPISVGVRGGQGRTVLLNRRASLPYFATHIPGVAAHGSLTWVLAAQASAAISGRPFALVGARPSPAVPVDRRLPEVAVRLLGRPTSGRLHLRVTNRSEIPQPQLQVDASSSTAMGVATIAELGPGATRVISLSLVGEARGPLAVEANPTMFAAVGA